jgi:23S rRNA (guanosine2251-2'-O)-methyltransferase
MREILYGRQPVRETLRAGRRQAFRLLLAREIPVTGIVADILRLAQEAHVRVQEIDRPELDKLSGDANHQGIAAEVSAYPYSDLVQAVEVARLAGDAPFVLLLDHLLDPQNLGSLLRSADATGVHGVILPGRRAAGLTPAAVRASAGAAEHVLVAQVTNLVQAMERLKGEGLWLAGLEATPKAQDYHEADLTGPLGLVVGSEGQGLARLVRERCDFLIKLPMYGHVESLNAAVAGAIALYEVRRQRSMALKG